MAVHLAAYTAALTTAAGMVDFTGLVDPVLTRSATSALYILQQRLQLLAALGMSATMSRIRLNSPTLRQINPPYMRPFHLGADPASLAEVAWYGDQPMMLPALEEIGPQGACTAAGPETAWFLAWLADNLIPVPPGNIYTARATSVTAAVAGAWTLLTMTMEQALPSGNYALVGSEHISATGVAHRFAIPNQVFRPGSLSQNTNGSVNDMRLMTRRLGSYGYFLNTAPPQIEVLCTAADAAHEIYLQLIKVGDNTGF